MKKSLLLILVAGFLLVSGLSGYLIAHRTGSSRAERPAEAVVSNSVTSAVVSADAQKAPDAAPRLAVAKTASHQPEETVLVIAAPGDRFQPIDEAQILDRRINAVSKDRKKRVLLVNAGGKYPFRRVEETLVKNDGADTYTISARTEMVADHVLVKLQEGKSEDDLQAVLKGYGVSILRKLSLPGHYIVSLKAPTLDAVSEALSVFSGESNVLAYAEPDYISRINKVPDDTRWSELWGMVKINATGAWEVTTGSTNVVVAVIDTGISLTHPDLIANLWKNAAEVSGIAGVDDDGNGYIDDKDGWDFVSNDNMPDDDEGHGSHCAGTIGAAGNNAKGVAGVCWNIRLMPVKFLDGNGNANSDGFNAVVYAADNGADIISASYGGPSYSDTERDAIVYANSKGVLFVAAAGNGSEDNDVVPNYPSNYDLPNIVAAAATDQSDALASFSNYGQTSVDLAAPGVNILSTVPGGNYAVMQGTSMATPHVAGAAALLLSAKPGLTHLQLKQALLDTVDPVASLANKTVSGGRLNVRSLIALQDTDGDGMPDEWELANGLNPNNPNDASADPDSDHLNNRGEYDNRCITTNRDTDADTLWDGWEVTYGFNPNSPAGGLADSSRLGSFILSGEAKNIIVAGSYAYVAAGASGLVILNIADPEHPVLAGSYDTGTANDVAVAGNYAYVADGANGLVVVNVSNPASPAQAGIYRTNDVRGVSVQSNCVYLVTGTSADLLAIDVSNPALPVKKGWNNSGMREMNDVFVLGGFAYAAVFEDVKRYDLGQINFPNDKAHYESSSWTGLDIMGIHGNSSIIAAAASAGGVKVMDTSLIVLGSYDTDGTASGVFVSGNYVYVADGTNGLVVLDIRTPSAPSEAAHVATRGTAYGVFVNGDKVYVAEGSSGVEIFSVLPDSDGDGMLDSWETQYFGGIGQSATNDFDSDGISNWGEYLAGLNPTNSDQDADGLIDGTEIQIYNTDPRVTDTDGDGLTDGDEISRGTKPLLTDTDGDGMNDGWEVRYGFDPLDVLNPGPSLDADSDGLTNLQESQSGTDPNDSDSDNDGMPDGWETNRRLNPLVNDASLDPDNDGLTNLQEYTLGTDPHDNDSDDDGMPDGWEVSNGFNPLFNDASTDADSDGLTNLGEYQNGTNPNNSDSDTDGMPDGWEKDHYLDPLTNDAFEDPDSDGLTNIQEYSLRSSSLWLAVYTNISGTVSSFSFGMPGSTDPRDADSDDDGLTDHYEITTNGTSNLYITNPNSKDTDGDKLPDKWEIEHSPASNPLIQAVSTDDSDGDGLTNQEEDDLGTNPANSVDPVFVDDDAPFDIGPQDPEYGDTNECGSVTHPFDSIQEAIDCSNTVNGTTILVTNGWYAFTGNYNISTRGKAITIRSWNGPADTTVTSMGWGEVFSFNSGETTNTLIKGLSIKSNIGECSDGDCDWVDIISISNASPVIQGCIISDGGLSGVKCMGSSYPQLISCTIADVRNGIWCEGGAAPLVVSNRIENAYITDGWTFAEDWGNGIYAVQGNGMTIRSTTIGNCEGRGMHIQSAGNLRIEDSIISNNWGGLWLRSVNGALVRSQVLDNEAPNYFKLGDMTTKAQMILPADSEDVTFENENGAGILLTDGSQLRIENAVIAGNRTWAEDPNFSDKKLVPDFGLGGGMYVGESCSVTSVNFTVSANHARTLGGGVSSFGKSLFRNAIIWGNTASNVYVIETKPYAYPDPKWNELHCRSGSIIIWHGDIGYRYYSDPKIYSYGIIITNNPLFIGPRDYRLSGASPCIDRGSPADAPTNDIAWEVRPRDGDNNGSELYDFGAYEYFYNNTVEDADRDGLSDAQEAVAGTNPNNPDTDGDGLSDGAEAITGTNPLSAASYFDVSFSSNPSGTSLLTWGSVTGRLYTVQTKTNLLLGVWSNVPGYIDLSGTGFTMNFTNSMPDVVRYYRIQVRQP